MVADLLDPFLVPHSQYMTTYTHVIKISFDILVFVLVVELYKDTPCNVDISFNQDALSCPKGVRNRGVPLYH